MTSTRAERDAIDARARELIAEGTMFQWDVLADEFGITRERARSSFARVQRQEQPKMKQIKAQVLYDLRDLTNFCSQEQLTDFFRMLGLGDSSVASIEITRERIMGHPVGMAAMLLLQLPLEDTLEDIMGYRAA